MRNVTLSLLMGTALMGLGGCVVLSESGDGPTRLERWFDRSATDESSGEVPALSAKGEARSIYDPGQEPDDLERTGLPREEAAEPQAESQETASLADEVDALVDAVMDGDPLPSASPSQPVEQDGLASAPGPADAVALAENERKARPAGADNTALTRPAVPPGGAALGYASKPAPDKADNVAEASRSERSGMERMQKTTAQAGPIDLDGVNEQELSSSGQLAGTASEAPVHTAKSEDPGYAPADTLANRQERHFPTPRWRREHAEKHANDPVSHTTPRGF